MPMNDSITPSADTYTVNTVEKLPKMTSSSTDPLNSKFREIETHNVIDSMENERKEDVAMNGEDMFRAYIEKVNRDQSDLRNDIRASEERIAKHIEASEDRFEKRLNRVLEEMDRRSAEIENKVAESVKSSKEAQDSIKNTSKWITGVCITTILGIAAMVIAVIIAVK